MKQFVGKTITKTVPFMGETVEVKLLTVAEVKEFEVFSKEFNAKEKADQDQLELLKKVIKMAVIGADDLTDEDFGTFPIIELSELAENIMGVIAPAAKPGNV